MKATLALPLYRETFFDTCQKSCASVDFSTISQPHRLDWETHQYYQKTEKASYSNGGLRPFQG